MGPTTCVFVKIRKNINTFWMKKAPYLELHNYDRSKLVYLFIICIIAVHRFVMVKQLLYDRKTNLGVSILIQRSLKGLLLSYCFLLSVLDCSSQLLEKK